jgi:hypothetical protein
MSATTVFTAGQVLSASALNGNFSKLPYAYAAGTANSTTGTLAPDGAISVAVTFPASRFNVAPIVQAWASNNRYIAFANDITSGTANITVRNVSAGTGASETIYWTAVQMTSGTAAG